MLPIEGVCEQEAEKVLASANAFSRLAEEVASVVVFSSMWSRRSLSLSMALEYLEG